MIGPRIFFWRVTLELPGNKAAQWGREPGPVSVCPIAQDKLQASKRAAHMLGIQWKEAARYMTVTGPIKAQAYQVRQWNRTYPQWSTVRTGEDSSTRFARSE